MPVRIVLLLLLLAYLCGRLHLLPIDSYKPTANEIFMAMWREALKTSLMDCMPIFTSLLKVAVGIVVLGSGNPLVWGGAWYFNKRRVGMMAEWEDQKRMANLEEKKKQKLKNA
jgi:hypothetical protein